MRITRSRIEQILGKAPKPESVRQKQFDHFDDTLRKLARSDWDQIPEADLWEYFHDLAYVELQPDLFRHVFPACLKFWYDTLLRNTAAQLGDADFHYALLRGDILNKMLSAEERSKVLDFFHDGFLDRLDLERGFRFVRPGASAQAWISRFNSLGLVAPIAPKLWAAWWSFGSPGQAVCAVMYATGLVYLKNENPVYLPWTREDGGGGPYLTEWDANYFDGGWHESNLAFLRATLTVDYVLERLHAAALLLRTESEGEMANRIERDAQARKEIIAIRIEDLLADLAKPTLAKKQWN